MTTSIRVRSTGMGLHTAEGLRKYVTAGEREAFLLEADRADLTVKTLCMTLTFAGCRLSEALALTVDRVDLAAGVLTFESLKKAMVSTAAFPFPRLSSWRSTWCTASASSRPVKDGDAAFSFGPGAG